MTNLFKKLFGRKNKDSSANTAILSEPDLTIARANNEMQLLTQAAICYSIYFKLGMTLIYW